MAEAVSTARAPTDGVGVAAWVAGGGGGGLCGIDG